MRGVGEPTRGLDAVERNLDAEFIVGVMLQRLEEKKLGGRRG